MDEEGLTVSFLKEKVDNFYVTPDKEQPYYPVKTEEEVVLEPTSYYFVENRSYEFKFDKNTKCAIETYGTLPNRIRTKCTLRL